MNEDKNEYKTPESILFSKLSTLSFEKLYSISIFNLSSSLF